MQAEPRTAHPVCAGDEIDESTRVRLLAIESGGVLHVARLEAIDATPVVDIKPALEEAGGW